MKKKKKKMGEAWERIVLGPINGFNCFCGVGQGKRVGAGFVCTNVSAVCPSKLILK